MIFKTNLTRRDFLRIVSAGTCGSIAHQIVSPFGSMLAMAQPSDSPRAVVIVYLGGGACHSFAPIRRGYNDEWFRRMGGIYGLAYEDDTAINGQVPVIVGNEQLLNPGFAPIKSVVDAGQLGILNQVGFYPDVEYTRSHDGDTELWQSGGILDGAGIIGRAISDLMNPLSGVSLDGSSLLVQGSSHQALSLADLDNLGLQNIGSKTTELRDFAQYFVDNGPALNTGNGLYIKGAMNNLTYTIDTVRSAVSSPLPNGDDYKNGDSFMRSCYDTARLLTAKQLGVKLVALGRGGWDTHSDGRASVYNNSLSIGRGLAALVKSLQQTGQFENTVILTMSEFSRTFWNGVADPKANDANNGSDHGHAGPVLAISGALQLRGVINPPAGAALTSKSGSYFKDVVVDFRQPYLEAFEWAGFDTARIFKQPSATHQFTRINYLRA